MKAILIRFLFRLLDVPKDVDADDKNIQQWLADSWGHPGFVKYMSLRLKKINRELSGGVGLSERTRPDYTRFIGQKFEILQMGNESKKAFQEREKKKKK